MYVKLNVLFFNSPVVTEYYIGTDHSGDWSLSSMLYLFIQTMGLSLSFSLSLAEQRQRQEDRHQKLTARDKPHRDFLDFGHVTPQL